MTPQIPIGQGFINSNVVPLEEREEVRHLHWLTIIIPVYIRRFQDAISVLETANSASDAARIRLTDPAISEAERKLHVTTIEHYWFWPHLAGRDAAMTIYHIHMGIGAFMACLNRCPTVMAWTDYEQLKKAHPTFKKHFPSAERLRNAVAHVAELVQTRQHMRSNAANGLFAFEEVVGRTLRVTYKGRKIEFEISKSALEKLYEVWAIIAPSMQRAIDASEAEFQKQFPEAHAQQLRLNQSGHL